MKTAQVYKDTITVKESEDIKLDGRKGAIVKVLGCGLCGSDIVKFKHNIVHDGAVLGHEIVAVILEINSDTKDSCSSSDFSNCAISCGYSIPEIPNNPLIIWNASLILSVSTNAVMAK